MYENEEIERRHRKLVEALKRGEETVPKVVGVAGTVAGTVAGMPEIGPIVGTVAKPMYKGLVSLIEKYPPGKYPALYTGLLGVGGAFLSAYERGLIPEQKHSPYSVVVIEENTGWIAGVYEYLEDAKEIIKEIEHEYKNWKELIIIDESNGEIVFKKIKPS